MIRFITSLILSLGFCASGITPEILDKLHIAHDPAQLDDDYMTTRVDCELRAGPGHQFALVDRIPVGLHLPLIFWFDTDEQGIWIRTEYNGKKGWIAERIFKDESLVKYIQNDIPFTRSTLENRCIVTQQPLNLYQYSYQDSKILAQIPPHTLLIYRYELSHHPTDDETPISTEYQGMDGWILVKDYNNPLQVVSEHSGEEFVTTLTSIYLREFLILLLMLSLPEPCCR